MNTARVDLHLHLDGSLDLPWAHQAAVLHGDYGCDMSFEEYYSIMYKTDYKTREESFKKFDLTCAVLQSWDNLHDATYKLVEKLAKEDMLYAEIRFASQQHCLKGLTQKDALEAVCQGAKDAMKDYPKMIVRIINCLMHKGNSAEFNMKENFETIEAVRELIDDGIVVGLDLAGYENNCPFTDYSPLFEKAREYAIPYTIHAGEMGEGIHVMDALDMKSNRIGHGIDCVNDPNWLKAAAESGIPFEVCLSSNCKTRNYQYHPIRKMLEAGIKVTINCDNMMFSRTNMAYEHYMLRSIGVSEQQLVKCTYNAVDAAFCDEETKGLLRQRLQQAGLRLD